MNIYVNALNARIAGVGGDPHRLRLEIVERGLMDDDPQTSVTVLRALPELGVQLSIDDFGTGCSSRAYL